MYRDIRSLCLSLTTKLDAVVTTFYPHSFLLTASSEHMGRDTNYTNFSQQQLVLYYSCALFIINHFNEIFLGTEETLGARTETPKVLCCGALSL